MKRRVFLLAAVAAAASAGATACSKKPANSEPGAELIVGLTYIPDIQFAPFYVAEHEGYFKDAGLNIRLRHHGQQETLMGALQTGDEHIVFAGGDEMMHARSQGVDVVNFATMYQQYPVVLIVPEDSQIASFSDLKGHSVGLPGPFGENWYGLLAILDAAGIAQDSVDIQHIGYTQQAALQGGRVDSVVGFINNDVVRFQNAGFPVKTIGLGSGATLVGVGLGAPAATVQNRKAELAAMLSALRRAVSFMGDNPDETVQIAADYVSALTTDDQRALAKEVLLETAKLYGTPDRVGEQNISSWTQMASFMFEKKLIDKEVRVAEACTGTVLAEVQ